MWVTTGIGLHQCDWEIYRRQMRSTKSVPDGIDARGSGASTGIVCGSLSL